MGLRLGAFQVMIRPHLQRGLFQRSDSAVKRGDHLGVRVPGIIVPVRDRAAGLPFKCIGGILETQAEFPAGPHNGA